MKQSFLLAFLILHLSLFSLSSAKNFKFNEKGEFTILQFTDFHYGETNEKDARTLALQRRLLDKVKPDLAVISGDAVGGYAGYIFHVFTDHGFYKKNWEKFTSPFIEANISYAYGLGNHDDEADFDRRKIVELDKTSHLSVLSTAESLEGTANYHIPIYSSKNQSHPIARVWMFDTGRSGCDGADDSYGCITEEAIGWYDQESDKIKAQYGTNIHHIAFIHIPLPEYRMMSNTEKTYGTHGENVGCPTGHPAFFDRVSSNGDITAIFAGHDHDNDFGGWYKGVELAYGRKSGHGSYGSIFGARVIKFKEVEEDGKMVVQREHYVIDEYGTPQKARVNKAGAGEIQPECKPSTENFYLRLRATGFFDILGMVLSFLITLVIIWYLLKVIWKLAIKEDQKKLISPPGSQESIADH